MKHVREFNQRSKCERQPSPAGWHGWPTRLPALLDPNSHQPDQAAAVEHCSSSQPDGHKKRKIYT